MNFVLAEADYTIEPNTGCWLWLGVLGEYAQVYDPETQSVMSVPRLILGLTKGDGLQACHRCDNPPCVNPDHLFVGTLQDNKRDEIRKGRHARGDKNGARTRPDRLARGERHGLTTLTKEQVREIRALKGTATQRQLASRFGVCATTVRNIHKWLYWRTA